MDFQFFLLEPFSWTALFISLSLSAASYAVNRLLAPKPPTVQRGKLEGELNIQNSQSGAFIPEIYGGDVSALVSDTDTTGSIYIDSNTVVVSIGGVVTTIGQAFAWHRADDVTWASNLDAINAVSGVTSQNVTRYWPGKGRYFKGLSGDVEAGRHYFIVPSIIEPVVADFPKYKSNALNGHAVVSFSGNEALMAQIAILLPDGTITESSHAFSASSRVTVFLLARYSALASSPGVFYTLCDNAIRNLSYGEQDRVSLAYFPDIDAFGFSLNDQIGDCYGVGSASNWVTDWFLATAIFSPVGDGVARRLRVNGIEQGLSTQRAPTSLGSTVLALDAPSVLIYGAASTVQQSSLDAYHADPFNAGSPQYSAVKNLTGDIAEVITIHATSEISDANLALTESVLMAMYGINA